MDSMMAPRPLCRFLLCLPELLLLPELLPVELLLLELLELAVLELVELLLEMEEEVEEVEVGTLLVLLGVVLVGSWNITRH